MRVDFRDEDRLQYRWDREVDGTSFLVERVGRTLKEGSLLLVDTLNFWLTLARLCGNMQFGS